MTVATSKTTSDRRTALPPRYARSWSLLHRPADVAMDGGVGCAATWARTDIALPQPRANSTTKVMPMCSAEAIASVDAFHTRSHTTGEEVSQITPDIVRFDAAESTGLVVFPQGIESFESVDVARMSCAITLPCDAILADAIARYSPSFGPDASVDVQEAENLASETPSSDEITAAARAARDRTRRVVRSGTLFVSAPEYVRHVEVGGSRRSARDACRHRFDGTGCVAGLTIRLAIKLGANLRTYRSMQTEGRPRLSPMGQCAICQQTEA